MLVLGITDGISCGAAVVRDGQVLAAVNEEALSRIKMAYGFPRQAISDVLDLAGVQGSDIDLVTPATINNHLFDGVRQFDGWLQADRGIVRNAVFTTAGKFSYLIDVIPGLSTLYYKLRWPAFVSRRRRINAILREEFKIDAPVEYIDHHLAHATSTYYTSGFKNALAVSMDGGGDGLSSRIYAIRDGVFECIDTTSAWDSPANFYAYVTHISGYKAQKHEGKITGLAAHGQPIYRDLLDSMITFKNGEVRNISGRAFIGAINLLQSRLPQGWTKEDLAASIQQHCEDLAVSYVKKHVRPGNPTDLAIAGGLFANVRINQKLYEIEGVDRLWVHPGMTDCGLAVGAALAPCMRNRTAASMPSVDRVVPDVYYGRGYTSAEIEKDIQSASLAYDHKQNIERDIAQLLSDGHVVARFNGRMEYGPRALGNRSILYQPADPQVNEWLNDRLKRTEFMPFAPSTTIEHADRFYNNIGGAKDSARFMTITFDCTDFMKKTCPGVVHVDGTARPQLVNREDNPSYYKIIEEFGKITGIPTIINTSFNMHEEPIVRSPVDAIRAFQLGHLDYLAVGEFLVKSPTPIDHPMRPMPRHEPIGQGETAIG
jgi:carbamoyltransferase